MTSIAPGSPLVVSRSSRGWKVLGPNGRTLARFEGRLAHRHAMRFARADGGTRR